MEFVNEDFVEDKKGDNPYVGFGNLARSFTQVWDLMLGSNDYRFGTPLGLILYYICTVFV